MCQCQECNIHRTTHDSHNVRLTQDLCFIKEHQNRDTRQHALRTIQGVNTSFATEYEGYPLALLLRIAGEE